jgi:hypothetical protein
MYSGHLMDELMQMVTRAESHAQQLKAATEAEPDPGTYFVPRFAYERTNQPVHAGVA